MFHSCYEDNGNYDYISISDIVIEGIEDSYSKISLVDTLNITPNITTSYADDALEYYWIIQEGNDNTDCEDFDTISYEKNLSYIITESPGAYDLFYYVKNIENGYFVHSQMSLEVETEYSRGHYILKETAEGNTDIDLLLDDDGLLTDILFKSTGATLGGAPRSMGILYDRPMIDPSTSDKTNDNCLGLITYDNNVNILRASDMYLVSDHNEMFYNVPENDVPYKFLTFYKTISYIAGTGIYTSKITSAGSGLLGFPLDNVEAGSDHWANLGTSLTLLSWDEINSSLCYVTALDKAVVLQDQAYPTNNYECLFMGAYSLYAHVLFRDKSDNSLLYLYKVSGRVFSSAKIESVTQISPSSKLHTATLFASNEKTAQLIYFIDGNKPYYYDVTTDNEYELNFSGLPSDETITYISNRYSDIVSPVFDYLTIATYKNGNYKVYMYNMVGGLPYGEAVRVVSGTGKVKETHYLGGTYSYMKESMGVSYSK